jgi:hypothetical protein
MAKKIKLDTFRWGTPKVGEEVILVKDGGEWFVIPRKKVPNGIGGNLDSSQKRYHGWRGTTDNVSLYAYGVRRVEKVEMIKEAFGCEAFVTLSEDLHPDWE